MEKRKTIKLVKLISQEMELIAQLPREIQREVYLFFYVQYWIDFHEQVYLFRRQHRSDFKVILSQLESVTKQIRCSIDSHFTGDIAMRPWYTRIKTFTQTLWNEIPILCWKIDGAWSRIDQRLEKEKNKKRKISTNSNSIIKRIKNGNSDRNW